MRCRSAREKSRLGQPVGDKHEGRGRRINQNQESGDWVSDNPRPQRSTGGPATAPHPDWTEAAGRRGAATHRRHCGTRPTAVTGPTRATFARTTAPTHDGPPSDGHPRTGPATHGRAAPPRPARTPGTSTPPDDGRRTGEARRVQRRAGVDVAEQPPAATYADRVILIADGQIAGTLEGSGVDEVADALAHLGA